MKAIVVGGGWAGIAAAVELARHKVTVTLIEAARQLGGRARRVNYRGHVVDNGQHLLIGAYHSVLQLLDRLGIPEGAVFERRPIELIMRSTRFPTLHIRPPRPLPAPWHLVAGLVAATGLGAVEKWQAIRFCLALRRTGTGPDCSVQELLNRHGQSPALIARLWEPLCLATLNTPVHEASAEIFTRVLTDAFARHRSDSDLLFPRGDLGSLIPEPAHAFIEAHGGRVRLGTRVTAVQAAGRGITGVTLTGGERLDTEHLVLALPGPATRRLLAPLAALQGMSADLARIDSAPITTVYLQYPPEVRLEFPMIGLHGTTAQWVFDHGPAGRPGLMAVVISGHGMHAAQDRESLRARVTAELAAFFPAWPPPRHGFVLRERRATFLSRVGVNALRPPAATPLAGCWLAGDTVKNGYPATLEGAVRSGLECARRIIDRA